MNSNPTVEMARLMPASCVECGAWEQLGKHRMCHTCHNKRYDALEDFRELSSMYRERLPIEVQKALDKLL